jgi:hypothetical protein
MSVFIRTCCPGIHYGSLSLRARPCCDEMCRTGQKSILLSFSIVLTNVLMVLSERGWFALNKGVCQ